MEFLQPILQAIELIIGWIFSPSWLPPADFELYRWLFVPGYGYGIILVAIGLGELLFPQERRPWSRRTLLSTTYLIFSGKMVVYATVLTPLMQKGWLYFGLPSLHLDQHLPLWMYIPIAVSVVTFTAYWAHRLMHRIPAFWHIHKIHHSVQNLNWSSVYHAHFLEMLLHTPIHLAAVLMLGTDLVAPFGIIFKLIDVLGHSNVGVDMGRWSYIISTPQAHRIHHSLNPKHHHSNFGNTFMVWDHVFGTFCYDPDDPPKSYGVDEDIPIGFFKQQILPLIAIARDSYAAFARLGQQVGYGHHLR